MIRLREEELKRSPSVKLVDVSAEVNASGRKIRGGRNECGLSRGGEADDSDCEDGQAAASCELSSFHFVFVLFADGFSEWS